MRGQGRCTAGRPQSAREIGDGGGRTAQGHELALGLAGGARASGHGGAGRRGAVEPGVGGEGGRGRRWRRCVGGEGGRVGAWWPRPASEEREAAR